ncbi:MAG: hypothetical protein IKD59_05330 [Lachnospiraceae bacterium]|nr:hypothetical protein [Lachnospiraceae bacterium]
MKIMICVPCMDQVPAQFAQSLATLNKVEECSIAFQMGSLIYNARNYLATMAIKNEIDYVLWLDSDMTFPPDLLQRLYEDRDKGDIITGIYYRRVAPYRPVLFDHLVITDDGGCEWTNLDEYPEGLFEIEGCGFGCVFMPTNIFMDVANKFGNMFSPIGGVGEDLSFCWRARQCGYNIVADSSIQCGHVGHYTVDKQFYEAYQKGKK